MVKPIWLATDFVVSIAFLAGWLTVQSISFAYVQIWQLSSSEHKMAFAKAVKVSTNEAQSSLA